MNTFLAVFIGGGLGSLARYGLGRSLAGMAGKFPLGTLGANVLATAVLALTIVYLQQKDGVPTWISLLVVTGFCGGFSTFSTFSYDTVKLFQDGNTLFAMLNVAISVLLCIFIAWVILKK